MLPSCRQALTAYERDLLARAARWPGCPDLDDLTEETLRHVAAREGIDFATAVAYDRVARSPRHGPLVDKVASLTDRDVAATDGRAFTVAVVPGAFFRQDRTSGADGRFVLESAAPFGCRTELVPLLSFGGLPDNARILRAWLAGRPEGERIILVSLSKGGAEVKLALRDDRDGRAFRNVTAWVSLSGIYHGTPLVGWLFRQWWRLPLIRLLFRAHGWDFAALGQLRRGPGAPLDFAAELPPHLEVIHVIGFPLARHLSRPLARRGHRRAGRWGPNDGGANLLADVRTLPGSVYPVWGADHFLRPAWDVRPLIARLLCHVSRSAAGRPITHGVRA